MNREQIQGFGSGIIRGVLTIFSLIGYLTRREWLWIRVGGDYWMGFIEGGLVAAVIIGLGVYLSPIVLAAWNILTRERDSEHN